MLFAIAQSTHELIDRRRLIASRRIGRDQPEIHTPSIVKHTRTESRIVAFNERIRTPDDVALDSSVRCSPHAFLIPCRAIKLMPGMYSSLGKSTANLEI